MMDTIRIIIIFVAIIFIIVCVIALIKGGQGKWTIIGAIGTVVSVIIYVLTLFIPTSAPPVGSHVGEPTASVTSESNAASTLTPTPNTTNNVTSKTKSPPQNDDGLITKWSTPWVTPPSPLGSTFQGITEIVIDNSMISYNSIKVSAFSAGQSPSDLSTSPFFFAWDTVPHDESKLDPWFSQMDNWFIQESPNSPALLINDDLLNRAIVAVDNYKERLTIRPIDGKGTRAIAPIVNYKESLTVTPIDRFKSTL